MVEFLTLCGSETNTYPISQIVKMMKIKLPKLVNKPTIIIYVAKFDYVKKKVFGPKTVLRLIFGQFQ